MPDAFLLGNLSLTIFALFVLMLVIQLLYYWVIFSRVAFHKVVNADTGIRGVSVVICARDACHHLKENLPLILAQDHPDFEVIVVNNSSDDDSSYYLSKLAEDHPALKIVEIPHNYNFFSGKKFPLSIGIKSAKKELILLTDADCRPASSQWLMLMQQSFSAGIKVVLGYGAYSQKKGLLNRLIRFDTAHIAIQYLSYALAGIPYMGVGRNMGYMRSLFFQNNGFISHYNISSGDDDLFINRVATSKITKVCLNPGSFTISDPKESFGRWMIQKKRHLSTGKYYRWKHKFLLATYGISMILFYALFITLIILHFNIFYITGAFLLRLVSQFVIFHNCMIRLKEKSLWFLAPILEILLLIINLYLSARVMFSQPSKWK